jgi:hypothetical protein
MCYFFSLVPFTAENFGRGTTTFDKGAFTSSILSRSKRPHTGQEFLNIIVATYSRGRADEGLVVFTFWALVRRLREIIQAAHSRVQDVNAFSTHLGY